MWWKKSSNAASPALIPGAEDVFTRYNAVVQRQIEILNDRVRCLEDAATRRSVQAPPAAGASVKEWLPVLDRMHEIALVAMGHPDLAQQFGLTSRQKESTEVAGPTTWTEPEEPNPEGLTYG